MIGGLAGIAQGAGWPTYDADVVIETEDDNYARVVAALDELQAVYDTPHQPPIRPDLGRMRSLTGPQLFRTRHGRLDVLKEAGGETYATLVVDAAEVLQHGHLVRCASLEALLRMKRAAKRPKDAAGIAAIEAAIRRRDER
ncbi:MAG: hypothetical protein K8H88_04800 [Sandaracinaceae bacterium]|nr:hypothetical protein [Sandaracinaceae bacterium]